MKAYNTNDTHNYPSGGYIKGEGISIDWEKISVKEVLKQLTRRLQFIQTTKAKSPENGEAHKLIRLASEVLRDEVFR